MAPRKGKKRATKSKTKKRAARPKLAAARALADPPFITIDANGNYDPPDGVKITPGGVVKFKISGSPNGNTCYIPFGPITFDDEVQTAKGVVGTIKVGSGN